MWEKWVALSTLAASTCLMRAAIGDILAAPGGDRLIAGLFAECAAIAAANGHAPRADAAARMQAILVQPKSTLTASMLRDVERNGRTEADHIIGDLLARRVAAGPQNGELSPLQIAYAHLKAYEERRSREGAA
jgi:2-dehydropantoate 2-reductase